jgi:hypothetical protein
VSLNDATPGATIYYTTNGTAPNINSSVYGGAITVSSTETIEAIATVQYHSASPIARATYVIQPVLTITTPTTLPTGVMGTLYGPAAIGVTGGGPNYTWTVNGTLVTNGSPVTLSNGITLSFNGGNSLTVGGTPAQAGQVGFTVAAQDAATAASTGPVQFFITINTNTTGQGITVNGQIHSSGCGGNLAGITVTLSGGTNTVSPAISDSNGNFSFQNVPGGTYTVTPSIVGPSSIFYPASQTLTVTNGNAGFINFQGSLGYTVTGTVNYSGQYKAGQVYVELVSTGCGGGSPLGTSVAVSSAGTFPAPFTIRGVPSGNYTLQAWMDNLGFGARNASNPTGSVSNVAVSSTNLNGASVNLADPAAVTLSSSSPAVGIQGVSTFDQGAIIGFNPATNNGVELASGYTVEWSADPNFGSTAGTQSFAATGTGGTGIWIVNGLPSGATYYFRVQGVAGTSTSGWSNYGSPVTINPSSGAYTVTGTVTFTGTATGPLYTGFYDQNSGNIYVTEVPNPVSPQNYTVQVPGGSNYFQFAILDQNNDGIVDPGDINNTNGNNNSSVAISGDISDENLVLPATNSSVTLRTQHSRQINQNGTSDNYNLSFDVRPLIKLPVAVSLVSGPNVLIPMDIGQCVNCGGDPYNFSVSLNGAVPNAGDGYGLQIAYSDGSSETVPASVSNVLSTLPTPISPTGSGVGATPDFSWTDPAGSYTYQFQLWDNSGNQIWQIPSNNSKSNGFSSSITSIIWGVDPLGGSDTPSVQSLTSGTSYNWQIQAQDSGGNSAQAQMSFTVGNVSGLSLPATNPVSLPSTGTVSQLYTGSIAVSGGTAPYTWTVTNLSDNLTFSNTSGNMLAISGTPSSNATVSFQVSVQDANGATAGPVTYTITITTSNLLALPSPNPASLGPAVAGVSYIGSINALNGVYPFAWIVNGATIPSDGSTIVLADGLVVSNTGDSVLNVSGTPGLAQTVSFNVAVTDHIGTIAGPLNYSILVASTSGIGIMINTTMLPPAYVGSPYSFNLSASGGTPPYSWGVLSGSLPNGLTLSTSTGTITGTPTAAVSNDYVGLQAADSGNPQQNSPFTDIDISVLSSAPQCSNNGSGNAELNGAYALQLSEADLSGSGTATILGEITADGQGNFTAGSFDMNGTGLPQANQGTLSGTYSIGSDNRGLFNLTVPGAGPNGSAKSLGFCVALNSMNNGIAGGGAMIEDDASQQVTAGAFYALAPGSLSASSVQGSWTFGLQGSKIPTGNQLPATRHAWAGYMTLDGAGTISGGEMDGSDDKYNSNNQLFNQFTNEGLTGLYTLDPTGRGTAALTLANMGTANFVFYVTAQNQLLMLETDPAYSTTGGKNSFVMAGTAQMRTASTFDNTTLQGISVNVGDSLALDPAGNILGSHIGAGFFTWNGDGTGASAMDDNFAGTVNYAAGQSNAITYAVDANGRVTMPYGPGITAVFYLTGQNQGVGVDNHLNVGYYSFENQKMPDGGFRAGSFNGGYSVGSLWFQNSQQRAQSGEVFSDGNGNVLGFLDQDQAGYLTMDSMVTATYTYDPSGRFVLNEGSSVSSNSGDVGVNPSNILYMVLPNEAYVFDASGSSQPTLQKIALTNASTGAPLTITTNTQLTAHTGLFLSQVLQAVGGSETSYTWSLAAGGALPMGFTLDPNSGAFYGTTSMTGTFTFTVQVTDSLGNTAVASFTLTVISSVVPVGGLKFPTADLNAGTVGQYYWYQFYAYEGGGALPSVKTGPKPSACSTAKPAGTGKLPQFSGGCGSGISYSLLSGTLPDGLGISSSGALSGTPTQSGAFSFTVQAADTYGNTATANFNLGINSPQPLSLPGSNSASLLVNTPLSQSISASGGMSPYTWTVNGSVVPSGGTYISPSGADNLSFSVSADTGTLNISGTPTAVESVILNIALSDNYGDTPATGQYTFNVVAGPDGSHNSNLNGTFACLFQGFNDGDGTRWASVASFQADGNGNITGGTFDTNGTDFPSAMTGTMAGTYAIGSDNNGLATISAAPGGGNANSSQWALALSSGIPATQQFRMVETDDIGPTPSGQHATANCYKAGPVNFASSTIDGNSFIFAMNGESDNSNGNTPSPKVAVGRFSTGSGTSSGGISNGYIEIARAGNTAVEPGAFTGSYTVPNPSNGRYTVTLDAGGNTVTLVVYIIDNTRSFILETTSQDGVFAGNVRLQHQTSYTGANLSGNFVLYSEGIDWNNTNGSSGTAGYYSNVFEGAGDGAGNLTINQSYQDDSGTYKVGNANGGPLPLTFDTTNIGRVTLQPGNSMVYLYLFNTNQAFEMSLNADGGIESGTLEQQTPTSFTDTALAGAYMMGQMPAWSASTNGNVGEFTLDSAGNVAGSITTAEEGSFFWDQPMTMTYSWDATAPGTGTFLINNGNQGGASCAVINATKAVCTLQNDSAPSPMILQE